MFEIDKQNRVKEKLIPTDRLEALKRKTTQKYMKEFEGKRGCVAKFKPGDKVLVFKKCLSNKLKAHWLEGFQIVRKTGRDSYEVQGNRKKIILNKTHIKAAQ